MKELSPAEFDAKVSADAAASGGEVKEVKMVRRCTGCNRRVRDSREKCCNAFYDSSAGTRRTGKTKMTKKQRRYLKKVVETAVAEKEAESGR